jgi:hypothetical protein
LGYEDIESLVHGAVVNRNRLVLSILAMLLLILLSGSSASQDQEWQRIAEGVELREYRLPGPNRAFVVRMDRLNPDVILESAVAQGKLVGGKETVSGMVQRYEGTLNSWNMDAWEQTDLSIPVHAGAVGVDVNRSAWGARNHIVAAINGSLHNINTGIPQGGMVQSGWYAKPFTNVGGKSGFVWKRDRSAFVGECVIHPAKSLRLVNLATADSLPVNNIDDRGRGEFLIIYTSQFDRYSDPEKPGVEMLVELNQPLEILPPPSMVVGVVRGVYHSQDPIDIPFGHIVLSAHGKMDGPLMALLKAGDPVGISIGLDHYEEDCQTLRDEDFSNAYASIEGNFVFLEDGEIQSFDNLGATLRHPRTAICLNERYVYFVVVDGRAPGYSTGMNMTELGQFCRDSLSATWGVNQDGGGSSTLWVDGEVVNRPSDGHERAVANGFMMVIPQAMERADEFEVGDQVQANQQTQIHIGPGNDYAVTALVEEGAQGKVLPHMNLLNGVLATGSNWWKVQFDDESGWVEQDALVKIWSDPPWLNHTLAPGSPGRSRLRFTHIPVE